MSFIEIQAQQNLSAVTAALAYAEADPCRRVLEVQYVGTDAEGHPAYDITLEHFDSPFNLQRDVAFPHP